MKKAGFPAFLYWFLVDFGNTLVYNDKMKINNGGIGYEQGLYSRWLQAQA